jgi:hypothetical protein
MSLLAGIFLKDRKSILSDEDRGALKTALIKATGLTPTLQDFPTARFCKIDFDAFPGEALFRTVDAMGMLAGDPVLEDQNIGDRAHQLKALAAEVWNGKTNLKRKSRGSYVAAFFGDHENELHLLADRGASKPLYYYEDARWVVFSSLLKVFENLDAVPKRMDIRALTEMTLFSVPLADRTPYADIHSVRAGEIIHFGARATRKSFYFRWDEVDTSPIPEKELSSRIRDAFHESVVRRSQGQKHVQSFLSGGLDSRCVAAELVGLGKHVQTFNFSPAQTLDSVLGSQFAACVKTEHFTEDIAPSDTRHFLKRLRDRLDHLPPEALLADRSRQIWDGGGTGLTVNLHRIDDAMLGLLRENKTDEAIKRMVTLNGMHLPPGPFSPKTFLKIKDVLIEGVHAEFERINPKERGRLWPIFMLHSYEGKHLYALLEELGNYRIELVQPFLDWNFVEACFHLPLEKAMAHRFFFTWLKTLAPSVTEVAWQAYPDRPPCPLPLPDLPNQWAPGNPFRIAQREGLRKSAIELMKRRTFCSPIFRKRALVAMGILTGLNLRDYGYAIKIWKRFAPYYEKSHGKMVMP